MTGVFELIAQAGPDGGTGGSGLMTIGFVAIFIAIFYFAIISPQKRREKEMKTMMDAIKTGDKILFAGGIFGTVTNTKEDRLVVKIADGVKVEVLRSAVSKVVEKEEKTEGKDEKK
jgi:preprotein translocase subunit YajC